MMYAVLILSLSSFLLSDNFINEETAYPIQEVSYIKCGTDSPDITTFIPQVNVDIWLENNSDDNRDVLEIPIAFHVIYANTGSTGGYISETSINNQIDVLNEAFNDYSISFILSSVDYNQNNNWYNNDVESSYKAALAISPQTTLNIYTTTAGGYLGYAYFPNQWPESSYMHGVVLDPYSLPGGSAWPYDEGDTAVHEVGHYLGLYHTFEGGCSGSGDAVSDTPAQDDGDNIFICSTGMDTCSSPGNDPIHNYMNYTDDDCLTEFTDGQSDRMDYMIDTYKPNLGCWGGYDDCGVCNGNNACLNDAPVAINADYSLDEDNQINIYLSATDEDGDVLTFSIVDAPNNGIIYLEGVSATYMPDANYNGYDSFTFVVNDGEFNSNVATVSLAVIPINDAPYLIDIPDAELESSDVFTYEIQAIDVDGDDLTYTVTIGGNANPSISGNILSIIPLYGVNGIISVIVTVSDGVATNSLLFSILIFTTGCTGEDHCNYNPDANVDDGSCVYPEENYDCYGNCIVEIDCAGECGGDLVSDCCGVCGGDNSSCSSCCGLPFNDDCSSSCYEDNCGICDDDSSNDCIQDCAGEWGGDTEMDECGVCGGDNTSCEIIGDLNGDGQLNVVDVVMLVGIIIGNGSYNPIGDTNEDGFLNVSDVVLIIGWILNP